MHASVVLSLPAVREEAITLCLCSIKRLPSETRVHCPAIHPRDTQSRYLWLHCVKVSTSSFSAPYRSFTMGAILFCCERAQTQGMRMFCYAVRLRRHRNFERRENSWIWAKSLILISNTKCITNVRKACEISMEMLQRKAQRSAHTTETIIETKYTDNSSFRSVCQVEKQGNVTTQNRKDGECWRVRQRQGDPHGLCPCGRVQESPGKILRYPPSWRPHGRYLPTNVHEISRTVSGMHFGVWGKIIFLWLFDTMSNNLACTVLLIRFIWYVEYLMNVLFPFVFFISLLLGLYFFSRVPTEPSLPRAAI